MRIIATGLSIADMRRLQAALVAPGRPLSGRCYPMPSAGSGRTYELVLPCDGCTIDCTYSQKLDLERTATAWCSGYIVAMTEDRNAALAEARAK
ncbi:MAG: hypothetical protein WC551_13610 [Patescibacteria group bacterium]